MIARALESISAQYKLAMRILFIFYELCSSIRSQDSHREGEYLKKMIKPLLFVYIKLFFNMMGQGELVSPKNYVSLHILVF